jgi:hypothetical protein
MMWEMETGKQYRLSKKHDIFSGLGNIDVEVRSMGSAKTEELSAIVEEGDEDETLDLISTVDGVKQPIASCSSDAASAVSKARERLERRNIEENVSKEISRADCAAGTLDNVKVCLLLKFFDFIMKVCWN